MRAGRDDEAREIFAALADEGYVTDRLLLLLGQSEQTTGRFDQALKAWSKVSAGSKAGNEAVILRSNLLIERGRWAEAEAILLPLVERRGGETDEARFRLAWLYHRQNRIAESKALIEALWSRVPDRRATLRQLWMLDDDPTQYEGIRVDLERASKLSPSDDRVLLGRANLAARSGKFDEASALLKDCSRSRPDDPAVWRATLDVALARGNLNDAATAARHIPSSKFSTVDILSFRAWLALQRGDAEAERLALEALIVDSPADVVALDRLATLATARGDVEARDRYRRRKSELDAIRDRYRRQLKSPSSRGEDEELAKLAEGLGRWFEAQGWRTLALEASGNPSHRQALEALSAKLQDSTRIEGNASTRVLADLVPGFSAVAATAADRSAETPLVRPEFSEDAAKAGLSFSFKSGKTPSRQLPETMSGGVGVLDFDGDGLFDVYCVQGGAFPPPVPAPQGDRLFRNRGNGTFEDVTERSGIGGFPGGYGHGVAVGDVDNDGYPDVFITRWKSYALYRNKGDGTFMDITAQAGLGGDRDWPTSSAFADFDGDGDLDLYVCHYVEWDPDHPLPCASSPSGPRTYCDPHLLNSRPDHLFRNDGGRFVDVSAEAGIVDREGRGLGVVAADLDGDDRIDIYVANDTTANYLFHNLGNMKFEEIGHETGAASSANGGYQAGMGVAIGDLDADGRPDIVVTNFHGESTTLYHNLGKGLFNDRSNADGLAAPSRFLLGFGVVPRDFNNDGRLDLASANGHVNDFRPTVPYAMPAQILTGRREGKLTEVVGPSPLSIPRIGRGLAAGDFDNDGRQDLLLVAQDQQLAYFHNTTRGGRAISFRLRGRTSNRDAVGAKVTVTVAGTRQTAWRTGGGSYLSANDPRLHFGLGEHATAETVEIRWPSGRVDRHRNLAGGITHELVESMSQQTPMNGIER